MTERNKKTLILNTLILCFCVCVIALFCFIPNNLKGNESDIYTISFDSQGGTAIKSIEVAENDKIKAPEPPKREGYIFVGWMYNGELYDFTKGLTSDITLTAEWKKMDESKKYYTVRFDYEDGTNITSQTVEEGTMVLEPATPTKDGFDFVEWRYESLPYNFNEPVNSNITIIAYFKEKEKPTEPDKPTDNTKSYKVTYNCGAGASGGSCGRTVNVKEGAKASNFTPTLPNHTFKGWTPNINDPITRDVTFTAQWEKNPEYHVLFWNNGSIACNKATFKNNAFSLNNQCTPTKNHYNLKGWSTSDGGPVTSSVAVTNKDVNVYAVWEQKVYQITAVPLGDGQTDAGYQINVVGGTANITSMVICSSATRCESIVTEGFKVSKNSYFEKMETCTITFSDAPGETFKCRK